MASTDVHQEGLFSYLSPESRIPQRHPLRPVREMVDIALSELSGQFESMYSDTGRRSIPPDAKQLYDKLYCARGDMENRIKENQLDMFGDRTSCQHWWPNQFRLLLASLAYTLIEAIRRIALKGTELANAYVGTIRLKLFKIGAVILKNTRRIRFLLASGCPYKELYFLAANRLAPG